MRLRALYFLSRLVWAITPTHQRTIMRLIPAYRRRDDELTERLIEGYREGAAEALEIAESWTNAGVQYSDQARTQ